MSGGTSRFSTDDVEGSQSEEEEIPPARTAVDDLKKQTSSHYTKVSYADISLSV